MKIAVISQSYPPMVSGAAIVARGLAEQMAQRGHQVLVLTSSDRPTTYVERSSNLVVQRLPSYRNPLRVNQRFTLWPHQEISAALAGFAPQVIHTHDPLQMAWSALLYARRAGVPVALTIHQLPWTLKYYLPEAAALQELVQQTAWAYSRWLLRRFQALVTPTGTIADEVQRHTGLAPWVIGFGVDPAVFHPGPLAPEQASRWRLQFGIPEGAAVLLHVGRLDKDKHVERVLQAAASVSTGAQPAHLLVVGDGTEKASLVRLSQQLQIAGRCHFPGFIAHQPDLAEIYRLAAAFVTASECETQGLVLLEAAASGLPIAAVSATCIPEIVHPGINGWLAAPGDIADLGRCIRHLLTCPLEAQALGQASRKIALELTLQKTVGDYERFYQELRQASRSPALLQGAAW